MVKAVLVINMPESCKQCVLCRGLNACKLKKYLVGDRIFTVYTVDMQIMEGGGEAILVSAPGTAIETVREYANLVWKIAGWNVYLDEILK